MKKVLITFLCSLTLIFAQFSDKIVKFDYNKSEDGLRKEDATVYYEPYRASYMFIQFPGEQNVRMQPDGFLYYYPKRKIALKLNNPDAVIASVPVQLFVNTGKEDLGLTDLGFELTDFKTKSDTLIRSWEYIGKNKDEYLGIDVFSLKDHAFKTISYDADGKLIKLVSYSNWIDLMNYSYPMAITILEDGHISNYTFSGISLLNALPDSVRKGFVLPEDCEIHEYKF